jgi:hypothetical protein
MSIAQRRVRYKVCLEKLVESGISLRTKRRAACIYRRVRSVDGCVSGSSRRRGGLIKGFAHSMRFRTSGSKQRRQRLQNTDEDGNLAAPMGNRKRSKNLKFQSSTRGMRGCRRGVH